MESIFESLENLNVSEECFDEIMGIVEFLISEQITPQKVEDKLGLEKAREFMKAYATERKQAVERGAHPDETSVEAYSRILGNRDKNEDLPYKKVKGSGSHAHLGAGDGEFHQGKPFKAVKDENGNWIYKKNDKEQVRYSK